jgi:hypothetical protein
LVAVNFDAGVLVLDRSHAVDSSSNPSQAGLVHPQS